LHIAGTGSQENYLKDLADSLGLSNRVIWHGFITDVPDLLRQADIFLLASLSEGLPNTLQEALAAGLLPIIRDVGGTREVISPALEPWMLPYEADAQAFKDVIHRAMLLEDEELLRLREEARQACIAFCDLETKTTELEIWLEEITAMREQAKK
jgi:glycosyltransferase involved in cell wall biosynthesis